MKYVHSKVWLVGYIMSLQRNGWQLSQRIKIGAFTNRPRKTPWAKPNIRFLSCSLTTVWEHYIRKVLDRVCYCPIGSKFGYITVNEIYIRRKRVLIQYTCICNVLIEFVKLKYLWKKFCLTLTI